MKNFSGSAKLNNVILVTTFWGVTEPDLADRRESELKAGFWRLLTNQGSKVFSVRKQGLARAIVEEVVCNQTTILWTSNGNC